MGVSLFYVCAGFLLKFMVFFKKRERERGKWGRSKMTSIENLYEKILCGFSEYFFKKIIGK
jgi:hypothetical protein